MKLKSLFTALLAAALFTVPAVAQDDDTPLGKEMSAINKTLKVLSRNVADPGKKEVNLTQIAEIRASLEKAATYEPAKTADIPAGEKVKFLADYKTALEKTLKTLDELKAAVTADKAEDALKAIETLAAEKKDGHKAFKKD